MELLTAWLGSTDWWTFIRRFATTKNGHVAWLALKGQMEGPAAIDAQKKKAHVDLDTSFYTGKSKNYTWDNFARKRISSLTSLLEAPVDEMRKVDLMFEGVKAEALGPVILALKVNGTYANNFDAAQQQIKKAINQMGIEARQAAAQRSISAVGTGPSGNNAGCGGKRTRGGRCGGSNKKQKGEGAGGQTGQQSTQPKFAAQDNPDVEIHAGYYPPKVYCSLSRKQQETVEALRKEKKNNKKDGSRIGAVVVIKPSVTTEASNGVAADLKEVESPDKSPAAGDPATVADGSGAPTDDEDSVIAVEDTKSLAISFGHESTQIVVAVAVTAKPVAKSKPEPRGPIRGWPQFLEGDKHWSLWTQEERDKAIFNWADYTFWREHEEGGAKGHYFKLSFGMVQSRYMDHSAS
jgi:hypothetical protein